MHSHTTGLIALAAITMIPAVCAHGWISGVSVNGRKYPAVNPNWHFQGKTPSVVWYSENYGQQDPVYSAQISTNDMACHINGSPGSEVVPVQPGDEIELTWSTPEGGPWRPSHEGPIMDYMASCGTDCRQASGDQLNFFKIQEAGMYQSPKTPGGDSIFGLWATDTLRNQNNVWKVTVPQGLSGAYVLRSEATALMGAGMVGHAQLYPQCVNLDIQGSGSGGDPCSSGADCRKGSELYKETDPGIYLSIWEKIAKYQIPGPALWQGAGPNPNPPATHADVAGLDSGPQHGGATAAPHRTAGAAGATAQIAAPAGATPAAAGPAAGGAGGGGWKRVAVRFRA